MQGDRSRCTSRKLIQFVFFFLYFSSLFSFRIYAPDVREQQTIRAIIWCFKKRSIPPVDNSADGFVLLKHYGLLAVCRLFASSVHRSPNEAIPAQPTRSSQISYACYIVWNIVNITLCVYMRLFPNRTISRAGTMFIFDWHVGSESLKWMAIQNQPKMSYRAKKRRGRAANRETATSDKKLLWLCCVCFLSIKS